MTTTVLLIIAGLVLLTASTLLMQVVSLWLQAWFSGAQISFPALIGMSLRKVDARVIVFSRIRVVKSGLDVTTDQLETHYLSGGRVQNVVTAMILARKAAMPLSWDTATAIDLAGRDIVEVVEGAADDPKWIDCEGSRRTTAVRSADGVLLRVKVRAKVRLLINRLVGGESEEGFKDRVADAATVEVARFSDGKRLADQPGLLNRLLMQRDLDRGSQLEVLAYDATVQIVD